MGTMVRASSSQWAIAQRSLGRCILRNKEREEQAWLALVDQGFRRLLDPRRTGHDIEIAARATGPGRPRAGGRRLASACRRQKSPPADRPAVFASAPTSTGSSCGPTSISTAARSACPTCWPPWPAATRRSASTTVRSASCPSSGSSGCRFWRVSPRPTRTTSASPERRHAARRFIGRPARDRLRREIPRTSRQARRTRAASSRPTSRPASAASCAAIKRRGSAGSNSCRR